MTESATRTRGDAPRVSIVLPCYNCEPCIRRSLRVLMGYLNDRHAILGPSEVLVVDDGSTDGSTTLVNTDFPEVRLIRHVANRGKGAAVRSGMLAATGRYRFFMDADLPFDLSPLERMLHYLDVKEFDVCIGTRPPEARPPATQRGFIRRITSAAFMEFVGRFVVTGVRDTQCGFKGFRAEIAEYLFRQSRVDNFAFDVELLYLAFKNDFDVKRIPVRLVRDDYTTVSIWRDGPGMLYQVLRLPFAYHSGKYELRSLLAGPEPVARHATPSHPGA